MSTALRQRITERENRLRELDREKLVLESELRAYRDALELSEPAPAAASPSHETNAAALVQTVKQLTTPGHSRGQRGPSGTWQKIWRDIGATHADRFSINDLLGIAQGVSPKVTRANCRSQAWNHERQGNLRRVSDGIYTMTNQGREQFGVPSSTVCGLFEDEDVAA